MKKVIELDETLAGEVMQIKDDFAVGPLQNIDTEEGWHARLNWWRGLSRDRHTRKVLQVVLMTGKR